MTWRVCLSVLCALTMHYLPLCSVRAATSCVQTADLNFHYVQHAGDRLVSDHITSFLSPPVHCQRQVAFFSHRLIFFQVTDWCSKWITFYIGNGQLILSIEWFKREKLLICEPYLGVLVLDGLARSIHCYHNKPTGYCIIYVLYDM